MASNYYSNSNELVLDNIKNFFSLSGDIKTEHVTGTVTGGLGINNLAAYPPPQPRKHRVTRGTEYVKEEREKEQLLEREPPGSAFGAHMLGSLASLEELSSVAGENKDMDDFSDQSVVLELQKNYYKTEVKYNDDLPITRYRQQILQLIGINRVVIIQGTTGCGKTTQVPQYILDHHINMNKRCNIAVTQPRKIAANSIARRVCAERNWQLGSIVGYKVGLDDQTSPDTKLTYFTTGVLLQKLVNDREINNFTHIIIDEVHERDQDTDFVILLIKKMIRTVSPHVKVAIKTIPNPGIKLKAILDFAWNSGCQHLSPDINTSIAMCIVILMSATIEASMFAEYFAFAPHAPAPIIEIEGKVKEIVEYYIEDLAKLGVEIPEYDYNKPYIPDQLYDLVAKLLFIFDRIEKQEQDTPDENEYAGDRGAVLVFLPGYEEIRRMTTKLRPFTVTRKYMILPLHSTITVSEQSRVFECNVGTFRKVILSTNIAESSITVPDVKYVIDFCLTKNQVCDSETNYSSLKLEWASKSNCTQRKGRAGRLTTGRVYRLVPKKFYEIELPHSGVPEMKRSAITQLVLLAKKINIGTPKHILALAMDPPEHCLIENAILELKEVLALSVSSKGEVSADDGDLTFIGRVMAQLPLDVKVSKLIILGYVFGCLEACIIIAASLSLKNFLTKSFDKGLDYYKSTVAWADGTFSDCFVYLNAYRMWKQFSSSGHFNRPGGQSEKAWGMQNYIEIKRIKEVDKLVKELSRRLEQHNMVVNPHRHPREEEVEPLLLKLIIAGAFYPNYYLQQETDEKELSKLTGSGDPYSTVYISDLPPNHGILYYHTIHQMMAICSARMTIEFEEKKAYIQFDRRVEEEKHGETDGTSIRCIHPAVYCAVKMRLVPIDLRLQVFNREEADRKVEQLRRLQTRLLNDPKQLSSKRLMVQLYKVKTIDLPKPIEETIRIRITHIVNCGHFWARYATPDRENTLAWIENVINMENSINLLPIEGNLVPGTLVFAPYGEQKGRTRYYRAVVEEIYQTEVLVFFIDYGNSAYLDRSVLRQLLCNEYLAVHEAPALAFQCQLSHIKPSALKSFEWTKEANQWFKNTVFGGIHVGKVYSVVQNIVRLELLTSHTDGTHFSINDTLVKKGYAEAAEESLMSRECSELRQKAAENKSFEMGMQAFRPFALSTSDLMGSEKTTQSHTTKKLSGPYSPLEVSYSGMANFDREKILKVDGDSVNSVSLNREPQNKTQQMLVASSVALKPTGDMLSLRSTTLMPRIPGLPSLMCLLFAPCIELRTNLQRTRYIGAICGLGCNLNSSEAIYPDHDVEVTFDVKFENRDLLAINGIRSGLDILLNREDDASVFTNVQNFRADLRDKVIKLLKEKRTTMEPENFIKSGQWNLVPTKYVIKPKQEETSVKPLLRLINGIAVAKAPSSLDEMKVHLKYLYDITAMKNLPGDVKCMFCGVTLTNRRALLIHLDSPSHRQNEAKFLKKR